MKTNLTISAKLYRLIHTPFSIKLNGDEYKATIDLQFQLIERTQNLDRIYDIPVEDFNYFCFNKYNKITCWPLRNGDQPLNDTGQWKKEGRQEIKPGKFIQILHNRISYWKAATLTILDPDENKALIDKLFSRLCEVFANDIRGYNKEIEYDISTDIESVYKIPSHDESGYLLNSCMRPESNYACKDHLKFYSYIPDIDILYKTLNNQLVFRALRWNKIYTHSGQCLTFLDRIYGDSATVSKMIQTAKDNNWAFRHFETSEVYFNGQEINIFTAIDKKAWQYVYKKGAPYLDTLSLLHNISDDVCILANHHAEFHGKGVRKTIALQDCHGDPAGVNEPCSICGCRVSRNLNGPPHTMITSRRREAQIVCHNCYSLYATTCHCCSRTIHKELIRFVDGVYFEQDENNPYRYCPECAKKHLVRCHNCGKFELAENSNMEIHKGKTLCQDCLQKHTTICYNYYSYQDTSG